MTTQSHKTLSPEKQLEICNAINAAVVAGKTVTADRTDTAHANQLAGAFPNCGEVCLILHLNWCYRDCVPMMRLDNKHAIRAYFPTDVVADIIYNPPQPEGVS